MRVNKVSLEQHINIHSIKRYSLAALAILFTSNAMASAETDFNKGVDFFNAEDYSSAVTQFESAKEQGIHSIALFYNLASCYYKLGKYEISKKHFKLVALTPAMRSLANYNLGLIALQENNNNKAREYFASIVRTSNDQKLIKLSLKQLSDPMKSGAPMQVYLSLNSGFSNNIGSTPDDSVTNISDSFYDAFISVKSLILGREKSGLWIDASFFSLDYADTNNYDEYQYAFGLKKEQKLFGFDTSLGINLTKNNYSNDDYLSKVKFDVKGRKALSTKSRLYLRYRYDEISSEKAIYDYLEGSRQRYRVEYRHYGSNIKQIYYELELNGRGELVSTDYTLDYSPTRHTIRAKYTHFFGNKWSVGADLSYRFSDYPASDTIDRDDDQWKIAFSTDYRFDNTFKLTSKLQFTDNTSTVDRYNYDKSVIKIGLSKSF